MKTDDKITKNRLYEAVLQSITDYVIAIRKDYKIIMANNLFKDEFGLQANDSCYKVWKGRKKKCDDCLVERSFLDGKIHQVEESIVTKNGKTMQMVIKSTPVKNDDGKIIFVLETATDITKRLMIQNEIGSENENLHNAVIDRLEELQKSEERYRTIFEYSRNAFLLTDLNDKIIEINQAGINILGYKTKNEVLTIQTAINLFEDKENIKNKIQKNFAKKGFSIEFETKIRGNHNRFFDALVTSSIVSDGDGQYANLLMINEDIVKARQVQQQIEKQNIRLSALNTISMTVNSSLNLDEMLGGTIDKIIEIFESDSARIYLLDEKKNELFLNTHKGFSDKFISKPYMQRRKIGDGLLGQIIKAHIIHVADNIHKSDDPYVNAFIEEELKSTVYIPLSSKGKYVGVMCVSSHSLFKSSHDYVEFLTAIGNQVGVAVENANLYKDIKNAYLELKGAKEQVVRAEKLASLGKLAATIAHEINNPLAAVLTYIRLMIKLKNRELFNHNRSDDINRYLKTMERETARCGEIVKNLLDFSRQSKIQKGTHSIVEIIDRTLVLLTHDLAINNIRLDIKMPQDLPMIKCDFKQIQQALLNLLSNAAEAMYDNNSGVLTIEVKLSNHKNLLDIIISDTGDGISRKNLKNIFEPFFTTKEEGKGIGLGLSVVYGIITNHNGIIDLKSKPGKGSSFTIRLPVATK